MFRQISKIVSDIYRDVTSDTKFYGFHLRKVYFSSTLGKV